jgi:hypothetical protein
MNRATDLVPEGFAPAAGYPISEAVGTSVARQLIQHPSGSISIAHVCLFAACYRYDSSQFNSVRFGR